MPLSKSEEISSAGITVNSQTGERYIPASVRADGSRRREIRVRPGYRPPEDVELYKNRAAEAWKNRSKGVGGVPGAEGLLNSEEERQPAGTAAASKNAKRKEARRKGKEKSPASPGVCGSSVESPGGGGDGDTSTEGRREGPANAEPQQLDPEAENEKKARNLKKKLRQARDLRDKKDKGESLLPEQLEKVIKINELIRQLDALGFDASGEKKPACDAGKDGLR